MRRPFRRRCYGTLRRRERAMRPPTGDHGGCRRHLGCVDHQYSAPGGQLPGLLLKRVIASCFYTRCQTVYFTFNMATEKTASLPVIAKLAGLTRQRVFQLHKAGLLPSENVGTRQARYLLDKELLDWCKRQVDRRQANRSPLGISKAIYDAESLLIRLKKIRIACRHDPKAAALVKRWLVPSLERELGKLKRAPG